MVVAAPTSMVVVLVMLLGVAYAARPRVVLQGLGPVEGVARPDGIEAFLGLPYAAAPVGARRFEAAAPPEAWSGVRDASRYGAPCLQVPSGDPNEFPDPEAPAPDEDCLFVNVWRPENATGLPIMVFIHGGGFCAGAGSEKWFDGSALAHEGAVVASLNYRLGPLGFLAKSEDGDGGMNGILDQIAALRFVQTHAASLGGDGTRVTAFGQSSGGMSVCVLAASPLARGLVRRGVVQSGPCVDPDGWGPGSAAAGWAAARRVFEALNATSVDDLRGVENASKIQWSDADMADATFPGYFVDGRVAPRHPGALYADPDHALNVDALIVGVNSKDGTAMYYGQMPYAANASNGDYASQMASRWGNATARVEAAYPVAAYNGSAPAAFVQADADAVVICPALEMARRVRAKRTSVDVFFYQLSHYKAGIDVGGELGAIDAKNVGSHWASHGADLPFVFGTTTGPDLYWNDKIDVPFTREEAALSAAMRAHWARFAAAGRPGDAWPAFDAAVLDLETAGLGGISELSTSAFKADACAFWETAR